MSVSEDIRMRDRFGHLRLQEGKYTPGEIDGGVVGRDQRRLCGVGEDSGTLVEEHES